MLKNKIKKVKTLKTGKLIYPLVFAFYFIGLVIIFILTIKFLSYALSSVLEPAEKQVTAEKMLRLNLDDYQLLTEKIPLETIRLSESVEEKTPELTGNIEKNTENTSKTAVKSEEAKNNSLLAEENKKIEANLPLALRISILNATKRAGLAGELKDILEKAGYSVENIGNQTKAEEATIIKIKSGLNRTAQELVEINKLVSEKYNFTVETLPEKSLYDLEIIIGNK